VNGCSPSERNGIRSLSPLGGDQGWNLAGLFSQENNTVDTPDLDRLTLLDRAQLLHDAMLLLRCPREERHALWRRYWARRQAGSAVASALRQALPAVLQTL